MTLELILKIIGWLFVLGPTITFMSISFHMIRGAAEDDVTVKALVLIALALFFMGAIMLLLLYLTDVFKGF
ncbi:hypothetical protein HZA85_03530 [Candidatus Uhrbacteria bacterium]|nr:hypothetical protein [Candidatus Uhrbacteria bacterium]